MKSKLYLLELFIVLLLCAMLKFMFNAWLENKDKEDNVFEDKFTVSESSVSEDEVLSDNILVEVSDNEVAVAYELEVDTLNSLDGYVLSLFTNEVSDIQVLKSVEDEIAQKLEALFPNASYTSVVPEITFSGLDLGNQSGYFASVSIYCLDYKSVASVVDLTFKLQVDNNVVTSAVISY